MKIRYARTNYLLLYCSRFIGNAGARTAWSVEVLQERTPMLDTISIVDASEIDRRFANGDLCFLVYERQRCLGLLWGHTGDCYIRGADERLTLDPHSVYLYGIFTVAQARRKGVYNALQEKFFQHYKDRNVTRAYAIIEKDNIIMKKTLFKAGFRIKSHIRHVRFCKAGIRHVHDYETRKMTVQFIAREPKDCTII